MKALWTFLLFTVLLSSCLDKRILRVTSKECTPIPKSSKSLSIPAYSLNNKDGSYPLAFWHYSKLKEAQLGLVSPEISTDSLVYRVWFIYPMGSLYQTHTLLEIKRNETGWHGHYTMMELGFKWFSLKETILYTRSTSIKPTHSSWPEIVKQLKRLGFDTLPTDDDIPGYSEKTSDYKTYEPVIAFEYSTAEEYRYYQYHNIIEGQKEFWQAQKIYRILFLLEREFQWDSKAWGLYWRDPSNRSW